MRGAPDPFPARGVLEKMTEPRIDDTDLEFFIREISEIRG
jgi:hypothetical protein